MDYKVAKSKDPKKPGYTVLCPSGEIANQAVMGESQAVRYAELLNAFALNKPIPHKKL